MEFAPSTISPSRSLLNAILKPASPIVEVTLENPFNLQDFEDDYANLHPVYSICLLGGILWPDATRVHHAFRLADAASGRILGGTLEIHTLELGRYTIREAELPAGDMLDRWLYWLLHAQEYEPAALLELLPQPAIRQATETLTRISQKSEDFRP